MSLQDPWQNIDDRKISEFGLRFQQNTIYRSLYSEVYPLRFILSNAGNDDSAKRQDFNDYMQLAYNYELSIRNSSAYNSLRETAASFPGVPKLDVGELDTRVKKDRSGNAFFVSQTRCRLPIGVILYLSSALLAYDERARNSFISICTSQQKVPLILEEQFKRVRASKCGGFSITPSVNLEGFINDIKVLGLEDTFLDINYLRTAQGIKNLLSFFSYIFSSQDYPYGSYVTAEVSIGLPLNSGLTTTMNALSVSDVSLNSVQLAQCASYPDGTPHPVHVIDCIILSQMATDPDTRSFVNTTFASDLSVVGFDLNAIASFSISRGLGVTTNNNDTEIVDTDPRRKSEIAALLEQSNSKLRKIKQANGRLIRERKKLNNGNEFSKSEFNNVAKHIGINELSSRVDQLEGFLQHLVKSYLGRLTVLPNLNAT